MSRTQKKPIKKILSSVWLFPAILLVLLIFLSIFKISGTSAGVYHDNYYGNEQKDSSLLFGEPREGRSDEWLVNTQLIVAQAANGFPHINPNYGSGKDMSLIIDVPYKEWSVIFKPQNLIFFVLPLENAFAFKWWTLLFLLITSCYFFILKILPRKKTFAILLSIAFGLSPFIFWWYQTITIMPLAYAFLISIVGLRILNKEQISWTKNRKISDALHVISLTYLLASFALVLYPPFQIGVAVGLIALFIGLLCEKLINEKIHIKQLLRPLVLIGVGILVAISIIAVFVITRTGAIEAITNTSHPGTRVIPSGNLNPDRVFNSFLMPILQDNTRAINYFINQPSEAANFILLLPLLLIPGFIVLIYEFIKRKKINFVLLIVQLFSLLLLVRMLIPVDSPIYHLFLFEKVPNERLLMGLGLLGILQIIFFLKSLERVVVKPITLTLITTSYGVSCFLLLFIVGYYTKIHYPLFINSFTEIIILASIISLIIVLFLLRRFNAFVLLFLAFSVWSVYYINPIYQGLGFLTENKVIHEINRQSNNKDTWVSVDSILLENFPQNSNRKSLSGVQIYPDNIWTKMEGSDRFIYNRYAQAMFMKEPSEQKKMWLVQKNVIGIHFTCDEFTKENITRVVSANPLDHECAQLMKIVHYPKEKIYIYKIVI